MRVVCIDDSNRPIDIPIEKWVKKDEEYTVLKFVKIKLQNNTLGVELNEIDLSDCFPYTYFDAKRFAFLTPKKKKEKVEELELELELEN